MFAAKNIFVMEKLNDGEKILCLCGSPTFTRRRQTTKVNKLFKMPQVTSVNHFFFGEKKSRRKVIKWPGNCFLENWLLVFFLKVSNVAFGVSVVKLNIKIFMLKLKMLPWHSSNSLLKVYSGFEWGRGINFKKLVF